MLTYSMDKRGSLPLYEYLYRRIRADILDGTLSPGEKLPSKRALAEHLHLSVITVESAYAQLEAELLEAINALGIGPQGFGGHCTALAVNIEEAPTHIAGLPVAVNINCHVTRHKTEVL